MTQLFLNVLTASFHGSIVIVAVMLLRLFLKKTPKKFFCFLWLLAFLRLLMPFEIQSELSLQPQTTARTVQIRQENLTVETPMVFADLPEEAETPEISPETPEFTAPVKAEPSFDWLELASWVWVLGMVAMVVRSGASLWKLKKKVRFAVQVDGGWESENIDTAFILTGFRPRIYIPMGMSDTDRRHILAHEQTHLEKGDHWIKTVAYLALAIHWFDPLVWAAYAFLCRDMELACDERVVQFMSVKERKEYSAALLKCSSSRAHFLSGPVAFGEVSVKNRILSVLSYKKPGFWVSLLGVLAVGFVAVCFLTSPAEKEEVLPAETTVPTETVTVAQSAFAEGMTETEILEAVTKGIREIQNRESYRAHWENIVTHSSNEKEGNAYITDVYRYGDDKLALCQTDFGGENPSMMNSTVLYGDTYGIHYGDYWVQEDRSNAQEADEWLEIYSPEGKTVHSVKAVSADTVCLEMDWENGVISNTGTLLVTFREDGTITKLVRSYTGPESDDGHFCYDITVTIEEDPDPQATWRFIADQAAQCITLEELEDVRSARNVMTEIPSNKTDYDQDVSTGIVSRQWEFLEKSWHCRIGSEEVTPTGLTQTFEESGDGHASFTVEEGFWLETFNGTKWELLREPLELSYAESRSVSVSWETRDSFPISWADSYGELPEGYYRLGRYYTVTMADGRTETLPCYCKFQIRNQDVEVLLKQCEMGVNKLVNSTDYYLKYREYLRNEEFHDRLDEDSHDMVSEVWRNGEDFYREITYRYKSDGSTKDIIAYLRRDGKGYGTGDDIQIRSMEEAKFTEVDWIDAHSFDNWAGFAVLFSPTQIVDVWQDQMGIIHVKESTDFYDGIPFEEQRYLFKEDGTLTWYQRLYYNEAGEEIIDFELESYRTAEGETREKIDSVAVN